MNEYCKVCKIKLTSVRVNFISRIMFGEQKYYEYKDGKVCNYCHGLRQRELSLSLRKKYELI